MKCVCGTFEVPPEAVGLIGPDGFLHFKHKPCALQDRKHCATCQCERINQPLAKGHKGQKRTRSWHHD